MRNFDFSNNSEKYLNNPAFISSDILTYEDYIRCINQTTENLSKNSFLHGEKVALLIEKNTSFLIIILALIQIGVIVVPLNKRLPQKQITRMLKLVNCSKIIVNDEFYSNNIASNFQVFQINNLVQNNFLSSATSRLKPIPLDQDSTIVFTSGSSENPKAVLHTFGNLYYSALGSNDNIPFKQGDQWLLSLPLYHVGGLSIFFRAIISGGTVVVPDENLDLIDNIKKNKITHISFVATQLLRLLENKSSINVLKNLKAILIGGGYIPSELIKDSIKNNLSIFTTYGSTEMASQITTTKTDEKSDKLFTSGKALKYRTLKIASDGEILVKGETLFKGYVENNKFINPVKPDGWYHTGDLGTIDNEGYLTVISRKDNMFISGGENIYPEEIEKILLNINEIADALVIDIPNKEFGARPVAFIKSKTNKITNKKNILEYLSMYLPKYKIPDDFYKWPINFSSFKPNRADFKNYHKNSKLEKIV